jgi:hypothetical protein
MFCCLFPLKIHLTNSSKSETLSYYSKPSLSEFLLTPQFGLAFEARLSIYVCGFDVGGNFSRDGYFLRDSRAAEFLFQKLGIGDVECDELSVFL